VQVLANKLQRDIKLNSDDASLTFIEVRRSLPDDGDLPQHSVAVGINLPFIGDETGMLMEEAQFIEKKYKAMKEANEARVDFGVLQSETLRNIRLLQGRRQQHAREMKQLKRKAVQDLSAEEYSRAVAYEYARDEENLTMEKEVMLGFISLVKESGSILDYQNLLTGQKGTL